MLHCAGKPGTVPALFNALYKKKTNGDDLDDVSARGLQGFLVVADAINRAPVENEKPVVPVRITHAGVAQCQK